MPFLGEAAALGTALCWTFGSLLFTHASRRIGSLALNTARITLAALFLAAFVLLFRADTLDLLTGRRVWLLAVSGWVGLTLGDWALFTAFALIGPRISTLVMAAAPPLAAAFAVPLLGETLGPWALAGMAVTLAGVLWVVLERSPVQMPRGHRVLGVFLAFLGAGGQALGLVLSKLGMEGTVPPVTATLVRMSAATAGAWLLLATARGGPRLARLRTEHTAALAVVGATLLGPVLGVTLSLVAVSHTQAGIAATLMAPVPVFILPVVRVVYGERVSRRAALGAVVAVGGVAILMLRAA